MPSASPFVSAAPARSRRAIIELLKTRGPTPAADLASTLKVSAMAVRQHLYAMQDQKLVTYEEKASGVGRPAKLWQLTPAAERYFPDAHAELATALLRGIRQSFGHAGLEKIMTARARQQILEYVEKLSGLKTVAAKVRALARLRTAEGYMAEVERGKDGTILLIENHCPVCSAAQSCAGLCQAELGVFQTVLGKSVTVERCEHMLEGSRRCVYQIRVKR